MDFKKIVNSQNNISFRAVIFMLCQIITQGIGIVLAPILTRLLTPADYGIMSVYYTGVSIVSAVVGLQINGSLNNANVEFDAPARSKYNSSVLFLSFLSFLVMFSLALILRRPLSTILNFSEVLIVLLVPYAFSVYCVNFASSYLRIQKKALKYAGLTIGLTLVTSILSLSFIANMTTDRYMGRIWGSAIPNLLFGIGILALFIIKGKTFYDRTYWRFCIHLSIPLIFHALAGLLLAQSDRIMLSKMSGESIAGIYSFCYTMAIPIEAIWFSLNNSWVPQYYEYLKLEDFSSLKKRAKGYNFTFTMIATGFVLVCPETIKILAPQSYWSGTSVIPMVVLAYYFTFLYSFPANHEFYHKKTTYISLSSILAAITNLMLNFVLIPQFDMLGAAIATLASYIALFLFHEIIARFVVKEYNYLGILFYLKGLILMISATVLTYIFIDLWVIRWSIGTIIGLILILRIVKKRSIF